MVWIWHCFHTISLRFFRFFFLTFIFGWIYLGSNLSPSAKHELWRTDYTENNKWQTDKSETITISYTLVREITFSWRYLTASCCCSPYNPSATIRVLLTSTNLAFRGRKWFFDRAEIFTDSVFNAETKRYRKFGKFKAVTLICTPTHGVWGMTNYFIYYSIKWKH